MSSREELRDRIRDNLDDLTSTDYRWSHTRINRVMEVKRRFAFKFQEVLAPGRYFKDTETLSIIADTQEYVLQDGVSGVALVERIANDGTALENPIPVDRIDFTERDRFQVTVAGSIRGAVKYYTFWSLQDGLPMLYIGFAPTPQTTGEDFRVHEYLEPWTITEFVWDPSAGSGETDDDVESGLISIAEDLLVIQSTLELLHQRPSVSPQNVQHWREEEAKLLKLISNREGDPAEQDGPRQVQYEALE